MKPAFLIRVAILVGLSVFVPPASAMNTVNMIEAYNGITVAFGPNAEKCGIRTEDRFRAQLENSLNEIGLPQDAGQLVHAHLSVTAQQLASLDDKCMIAITLAFTIPLKAEFITVSERMSHRDVAIRALEQVDPVPIVLYEEETFDAEFPTAAESRALYLVEQAVQRFEGQRSAK